MSSTAFFTALAIASSLIFSSPSTFAQGSSSEQDSCTSLLTLGGISFPPELKLQSEKVELLLKSEHATMIETLGRLFHQLESRPEIFFRLPYILNSRVELARIPAPLLPEIRSLVKERPGQVQMVFSTRHLQLSEMLKNDLLNETQIQWLALLLSELPVMEYFSHEFESTAELESERKLDALTQRLALLPKHREFFEAMLQDNGFANHLGDVRELLTNLLSEGGTKPEESYQDTVGHILEILESWDFEGEIIQKRKLAQKYLRRASFLSFRASTSTIILAPGIEAGARIHGQEFFELKAKELFDEGREIYLNLIEDIYFKTDLKRFNHKAYMDVMEFVFFGTPIPYTQNQIYNSIIEASKRLVLPAKNHLVQLHSQRQSRSLAEHRNSLAVTPFVLKIEESVEFGRESKGTSKLSKKSASLKAAPLQKDKNEVREFPEQALSSGKLQLISFTKYAHVRKPFDELKPNTIYELVFLRDPKQLPQGLQFSAGALAQMRERPLEALQVIDGILIGFTNRSFHGAGLKRLHHKTVRTGESLYEARPNRNAYRMILRKQDHIWTVVAFVPKSDFYHEVERVRGAL